MFIVLSKQENDFFKWDKAATNEWFFSSYIHYLIVVIINNQDEIVYSDT